MRKESNYNNTVIYKIYCNDESSNKSYIGHSTNFTLRKHLHKFYSKKNDTTLYKYIRENGGWDNFVIERIEEHPCSSKKEALQRERYFIDLLKPELNENLPLRSYKELREKNKEKYNLYMKEYMKKYYRIQKAKQKHLEVLKKDFIIYFD